MSRKVKEYKDLLGNILVLTVDMSPISGRYIGTILSRMQCLKVKL